MPLLLLSASFQFIIFLKGASSQTCDTDHRRNLLALPL
jgi:hypothetical protein